MILQSRWKRDTGVKELIETFDEEKYIEDPSILTIGEIRQLAAEIKRCQDSFEDFIGHQIFFG